MPNNTSRWKQMYCQSPLGQAPLLYAQSSNSAYRQRFRQVLLENCPRGGTALETGIGAAYESLWLSLRGVNAFGIDSVAEIAERANQLANMLESGAQFSTGDLFDLYVEGSPRWDLIHHQGVMEHFSARRMRAAIAIQACMAKRVAFSIPSMHYPYEPEMGDELLWPLPELQFHLAPFDIETLEYYGDPAHGGKEHILCVLRGQEMNDEMRAIIAEADAPYEPGITALIMARNEEVKLPQCLAALHFADAIVIADMSSSDSTRQIAIDSSATVVKIEHVPVFDFLRNIIAQRAKTKYCLVVDCDEIIPPAMAEDLVRIAADETLDFAGMYLPFKHYIGSHWLTMLGAGYTAPRLLRTGLFYFCKPLHGGVRLEGPSAHYPASDPNRMIVHRSNDSLSDYQIKQNAYTSSEAEIKYRNGAEFSVVEMLLAWLRDLVAYHDNAPPSDDGPWRLIYSFCGANYRFLEHAKLFERRYNAGLLKPHELQVPGSVPEILALLNRAHLLTLTPGPDPAVPAPIALSPDPDAADLVFSAPFEHVSGYGEESRGNLFAIHSAGIAVRARCLPWGGPARDRLLFTPEQLEQYDVLYARPAKPGFVHLIQDLGNWQLLPDTGATAVRFMYETDRLPRGVPQQLNRMDLIIVPSEFNRRTFTDSGVDPGRIAIVPGCIDPAPYLNGSNAPSSALADEIRKSGRYTFLSIGEMSLRKGFDVLIPCWLRAFEGRTDVQLVIKTWCATVPGTPDQIRERLARAVAESLGVDLLADDRVRILTDEIPRSEMPALYGAADAFVSATRAEGWGRPLMEAMACGKPAIATGGTGNTAFMNAGNSWLVDYDWVPVSGAMYAEIPAYKGHRCVEIRQDDLIDTMRYLVSSPAEAEARAKRGREEVCERFNLEVVGKAWAEVLGPVMGGRCAPVPNNAQLAPNPTSPQPSPDPSCLGRRGRDALSAPTPNASTPDAGAILPVSPSPCHPVTPSSGLPVSPSSRPRVPPSSRPPVLGIRLIGDFFMWHSLGLCNREIGRRFAIDPDINLSIVPLERAEFGPEFDPGLQVLVDRACALFVGGIDFEIRHHYPPRFNRPLDPRTKLILIAPWEYYRLPEPWIKPIIDNVTEIWAYSETVKKCYVDSGVPAERIQVIPLGVDTNLFRPDAPPYQFTDEPGAQRLAGFEKPPTIFLAVGTIDRKGLDTLLEAYCNTFSFYDNVILVVKDTGVNTVYRGGTQGDRLRALANSPTGPAILYIEQELPPVEHAGLFKVAHMVVLPYHNEGFCLPALEAMASGTPPCVPAGGPTDDFCDADVAVIVPATLEPTGTTRVGEWQCCGETSRIVINPRDLGRAMRWAHEHPEETAALGAAGAKRARDRFTWDHTVAKMKERLLILAERDVEEDASVSNASKQETSKEGKKKGKNARRQSPNAAEIPPHLTSRTGGIDARSGTTPDAAKTTHLPNTENRTPDTVALRPNTEHRTPNTLEFHVRRAQPTIALTMIMRDEELNLDACLTSVKPWVTKIYIVDTGSKDRSIEIAESHGAIVICRPWDYSFSNARNASLDMNKGEDYNFWMDCDDVMPPECGEGMQRVVAMAEDRVTAYLMQVHIPPARGADGVTIVDHLKLFRHSPKHRWENRIHEQMLGSIYAAGGIVQRTNLYVVHAGYDYSPAGQKKKRERDEYLLKLDEEEMPDHPFPKWNRGMSLHHWGDHERAVQKLEQCLALSKSTDSTVRKVYSLLGASYMSLNRLDEARASIDKGLSLYPRDPELLFRAANFYREMGDPAAAERFFLRLFNNPETGHIDSIDVSTTAYKGRHNYALALMDLQRYDDAEAQLRVGLAEYPAFAPSWNLMGELFVRRRRFDDARGAIERLAALGSPLAQSLRTKLAAAQNTRIM